MTRGRTAVGALGAAATLAGATAVVRPGFALDGPLAGAVDALAGLDPRALSMAGVALVALSVLASALLPDGERPVAGEAAASDRFDRALDDPPEAVQDAGPRTARALDVTIERAVAGDEAALDRVHERLADLVVAALAAETDPFAGTDPDPDPDPETEARRAVETGAWTDDRTAAAFLSGPEGPAPSLRSRLRLWLDPETERRRRVDRTVDAVETLGEGDR